MAQSSSAASSRARPPCSLSRTFLDGTVVEVAGIEPASAGFSVGLLRAQSTGDCRGRRCCRRRRRPVSDLVVPRAPSAMVRGKPYFMMPVNWTVGLGPGGHRCPRQRARAEARRLFVCSGSLTWLRRPRLASPTSTTNVETIHPRVARFCTAPPSYRSALRILGGDSTSPPFANAGGMPVTWGCRARARSRARPSASVLGGRGLSSSRSGNRRPGVRRSEARALGAAQRAGHVALGVALGEVLAAVVELLALGDRQLDLDLAGGEVDA